MHILDQDCEAIINSDNVVGFYMERYEDRGSEFFKIYARALDGRCIPLGRYTGRAQTQQILKEMCNISLGFYFMPKG